MASYDEIAKAYVTLIPTLSGAENKIKSELGGAVDAGAAAGGRSGGNSIASSIGSSIKNIAIGNILANAITSAAGSVKDAVTGVMSDAFGGFAEYEQLAGGVETLFKDSADTVKNYADQAYLTAGMDANQYMDTVTSFSASLIAGLGGDTAAAAEIADKAIVDMADNANKMGTPIENIQNAYQGFAKQNFTMLDNLKLGYGGTQAEMARLINDSGVMGDAFEATANNVKDIPFDKMIEAIHVVQENLGIAGATGEEAMETIEGSIKATQSAWSNWLTGLGRDDADMGQLTDNLVNSFTAATKNAVPRIGTILGTVIKAFPDVVASVKEALPGITEEIFAALNEAFAGTPLEGLGDKVTGFVSGMQPMVETVVGVLRGAWEGAQPIIAAIMEHAPKIAEAVGPTVQNIGETLGRVLPPIGQLIADVFSAAMRIVEALWPVLEPVLNTIIDLVGASLEVMSPILGVVVDTVAGIIEAVSGLFEPFRLFAETVALIAKTVTDNFEGIPDAIGTAFGALVDIISAPFRAAFNAVAGFWNDTVGQLTWEVPDWVPAIGGQTMGAPKIPMLAAGGVVTDATQAIIGEAGPEAVVPLDSAKARRYMGDVAPQQGITPAEIKQAIAEGMAGFAFNLDGKPFAHATRGAYDRANGAAHVYQSRGLAYA